MYSNYSYRPFTKPYNDADKCPCMSPYYMTPGSAQTAAAPGMGATMTAGQAGAAPAYGTIFPTGIPAGLTAAPMPMPQMPIATPSAAPAPQTTESPLYIPGFLKTQIGRRMRVEFLIGTNGTTDRTGILTAVGASYILLHEIEQDDIVMCDLYSIKFVTIML